MATQWNSDGIASIPCWVAVVELEIDEEKIEKCACGKVCMLDFEMFVAANK